MSCFGCSKSYGFFTKEYGCPNCGYSYCSKCLKRSVAVPRKDGKVLNVCLICYDKLSKLQASANEKVIDIEALPGTLVTKSVSSKNTKKGNDAGDVDALFEANPPLNLSEVLAPFGPQSADTADRSADLAAGVEKHSNDDNSVEISKNLDCIISKRLQDLKTGDNLPPDSELRARLANLTGMPQKDYSKKDLLLDTDERTQQQKINDLLEQFMGETQIDQNINTERNDAISDIERRLRALRNAPLEDNATGSSKKVVSPESNTPSDNEQDSETMLKDILEKYLAESRLPEVQHLETELESSIPLPPAGTKPSDQEELPFCTICTDDAVFRCKGCDGELFCASCYSECHDDDEDLRAHIKEKYSAPPSFKDDHF